MQLTIEVIKGDITRLAVDAIVNAANNALLPGSGVCGAIHKAAGPELARECREIGHCETGRAVLTKGYNLPARFVIHTVGPVWKGGQQGEEDQLISCYKESLKIAAENGLESIAFPCISTGIYRYPPERAMPIAVGCAMNIGLEFNSIKRIFLCCYDNANYEIYRKGAMGEHPMVLEKLSKEDMWD